MTELGYIFLGALVGSLAGPLIHHVAVQAGADAPFDDWHPQCRRCGTARRSLVAPCDTCGLGIRRILLTSALSAGVSAGAVWALGTQLTTVVFVGFVAVTCSLILTDLDHKRIPNRITYKAIPLLGVALALGALADGTVDQMPRALLAMVAFTGFFFFVYIIARGGFGFGDVKLAILLGLFLGFLGWEYVIIGGMLTALLGALAAVVVLLATRASGRSEFPYGPPMIVGAWISIIFGSLIAPILL